MKSKRNTVWIVLTCMLAVLVFVLSAALYRSWRIMGALQTQLTEVQNGALTVEVVQGQQEVAAAGTSSDSACYGWNITATGYRRSVGGCGSGRGADSGRSDSGREK